MVLYFCVLWGTSGGVLGEREREVGGRCGGEDVEDVSSEISFPKVYCWFG